MVDPLQKNLKKVVRAVLKDIQIEGFHFTKTEEVIFNQISLGEISVNEARKSFLNHLAKLRIDFPYKFINPTANTSSADPYQYEQTKTLINKLSINDQNLLKEAERNLAAFRMIELCEKPILGKFNFEHLQAIHQVIFQDVFPWAGEIRKVDFRKGGTIFCLVAHIYSYQQDIFNRLKRENYLRGLEQDQFIQHAAGLLGDLNALHPFREGNGRAQREFLRELGWEAGYIIDFSKVTQTAMIFASRESFTGNNKEFERIIRNGLTIL